MLGLVIGSAASRVGDAWIGAPDSSSGASVSPPALSSGATFPAPRIAFVYKPSAFGPGASVAAPSVRRIAKPAAWSNMPAFQTLSVTFTLKLAAFANGQSFFATSLKRTFQPAGIANGATFFGPRLTLRIAAVSYANPGQVYTAAIAQGAATKTAPHRPSSAVLFAPTVTQPATTSVTVTLSLPGLIPRAPKAPPRRPAATWPNLPNVAAPPWRLTVVTPDVARERARQRLAAIERAERVRRKRKAEERGDALVAELIDEAIVRTIARGVAEAR